MPARYKEMPSLFFIQQCLSFASVILSLLLPASVWVNPIHHQSTRPQLHQPPVHTVIRQITMALFYQIQTRQCGPDQGLAWRCLIYLPFVSVTVQALSESL